MSDAARAGWLELTCTVERERLAIARHRLEQWGALAIVEEGEPDRGECRLTCDFPGETHPDALRALLDEETAAFAKAEIRSYPRPGGGAGTSFAPYEIVPGIRVVLDSPGASAETRERARDSRDAGPNSILLDPAGVFGTGQHQTSALCARFLDAIVRGDAQPPRRALDAGTGTGILALLAARLGIGEVFAVENDPGCLAVAQANFARNPFARGRVSLVCADLRALSFREAGAFDLVLANLLGSTLHGLETAFRVWLARPGHLVASGMTEEQMEEVESLYGRNGWKLRGRAARSGWAALWLSQP